MTMSRKERERLVMFGQIKCRQIGRVEAAEVLGMSLRQLQRLYPRWLLEGDSGLAHRSRGRASGRRWDEAQKLRALALYRSTYRGFGPTLLSEKLESAHGIWASHDTVRRWLIEAGLLEKTRRGRRSRRRRARMERFGQMLQMDGSLHAWFEDASGTPVTCVLMTIIDDATGRRRGRFFTGETLVAAMQTFSLWCQRFGVPEKLYVDRHGIYRADRDPMPEELKAGKKPVTQFGRAMNELNVELILARSPQAKGRVERSNGVLQDRLIKELRLAKITSIEQANAWLDQSRFWEQLDTKFAVEALDETDAHRPLVVNLVDVLCVKEKRSVGSDGCVQWYGRVLQLSDPGKLKQVEIWEHTDDTLEVLGDGRRLSWQEIDLPTRRARQARVRESRRGPVKNNKVHKPTKAQQITLKRKPASAPPAAGLRKAG